MAQHVLEEADVLRARVADHGAESRYEAGAEAVWIAEEDGAVVGLAGLLRHGRHGELEPVVVAERFRGSGIGRRLVEAVVAAARERGFDRLTVRPTVRNVDAVRFFHSLGFDVLGHVDLQIDLAGTGFRPRGGERLADREFRA